MGLFLATTMITASHFLIITGVWSIGDRYFSQALFPVLGAYLLIGPLPYLWQTYKRQQRFDYLSQSISYLIGLAMLFLTLGYVWQCRVEVLAMGIPIIVNNPPRLTALTFGFIVTGGFLSYLLAWLSTIRLQRNRPTALLTGPYLRIPIPKGISKGNEPLPLPTSLPGESVPPLHSFKNPSRITSASPSQTRNGSEQIPEKNRLTTREPNTISEEITLTPQPSHPKKNRGPSHLETIEISKLKEIQEGFSSLTGLSLLSYKADGETLINPSLENPICQVVRETPKGIQHCKSHCGKSIGIALKSNEPVFFKCDVGLHVFTIPVTPQEKDEKSRVAFLGGKVFFNREEFSALQKSAGSLDISQDAVSRLTDLIRVADKHTLVSSARFLESVIPYLLTTLYEKNAAVSKLARMMTLFTLTSTYKEEREFQHEVPILLNTLGILFGFHTASITVFDPIEKQFKTEAAFGQKANLINPISFKNNAGLIGTLLEKGTPVISHDTMEILKIGLPAEISSVALFPLLIRNRKIIGILAIFDTPLTDEDVMILTAFCQQIAAYQENKDYHTEYQELSKDISVLLEIAKTVGSTLDSDDLFGIILDKSTEFLEAEQGSIMILDEEREELTVKAMKGLNEKIVGLLKIRPGEGISGKVLSSGNPLVVKDIENDQRITQGKRPRYKTKSFISIPLKLNDRTIGILNIADKITGEVFSENDLRLLTSIGAYASVAIERSKFYKKNEELKKISITDSLTGLLNRRYFQERISEEIERSRRHVLPLSLIIIDIDDFKAINDSYGHMAGDEALKILARCLRNCIRTIDVAARYGGEEFTMILPQTSKSDALVIADRVCKEVRKLDLPLQRETLRTSLSVSVGLATFPEDSDTLEGLIRNTDIALYQAKTQGKNRVVAYQPSPESSAKSPSANASAENS